MQRLAKNLGIVSILPLLACTPNRAPESKDGGIKSDVALADKNVADAAPSKDLAKLPGRATDASSPCLSDPSEDSISKLELQGRNLYWLSGYRRVVKGSLQDLSTKVLFEPSRTFASDTPIMDFAIDGTHAYVTYASYVDGEFQKRGVYRVALDGSGTPERLVAFVDSDASSSKSIAVSGGEVFYCEGNAIRRVKTSGGEVTTLTAVSRSGFDEPKDPSLLVHQGYVYFTMRSGGMSESVYRVPVTASVPATADGGAPGETDGGAKAALEKVSLVDGMDILLAPHVDKGFVYWATENTVYRTDGTSPAKAVFNARNPANQRETGINFWLFALDGVIYWGQGNQWSGSRTYKQAASEPGIGTVLVDMGFAGLAGDTNYLYGASDDGVWCIKP